MSDLSHVIAGSDLERFTTYEVGAIHSTAYRVLKKHTNICLRENHLTTMQWIVIGTVYDCGAQGIRLTDLAQKVDTTLSFLTNTVNDLEARNILLRTESIQDSRVKYVTVTPAFMTKVPLIEADLWRRLRKSIYSKISPGDLHTFIKVLVAFNALADPEDETTFAAGEARNLAKH